MSNNKKVSVIMPVYNCESTVAEAIDSILNQTYPNIQIIICDDGSTDNTFSIVKKYESEYPEKFIVVQNEKNSKLHFSLNHCLELADGDYIARMDGDDISLPERIEKQVAFLEENPQYSEVGTAHVRFDDNGDYGTVLCPKTHNASQMKHSVPSCHACIMMRKGVYESFGGYTVSKLTERAEDVDMWFKFYAAGHIGANLPDVLYKVREDRTALKRRRFKDSLYCVKINFEGFRKLKYPIYLYPLILRPLVSFLIPHKLKAFIRTRYAEKKLKE